MDPIRLSKTMAWLLKQRQEAHSLAPDGQGFVSLEELCDAVSRLLQADIRVTTVRELVNGAEVRRFEIVEERIRAVARPPDRRGYPDPRRPLVPEILYHATTSQRIAAVLGQEALVAGLDRPILLSASEPQAWRVAHRMHGEPAVLYIDAARARRHGVRFARNRRNGLWMAERIPAHDILNLQSGFDQQLSAGGFPVRVGPDGAPQLALVRVSRRNGSTWEVAKGKLELGEPPELAAIREVREEMGLAADLRITRSLGTIRYGFLAPGGLPRLKIVFLYLMAPVGPISEFAPRSAEGINDVRWFGLDEAQEVITHISLRPAVRLARDVLAA